MCSQPISSYFDSLAHSAESDVRTVFKLLCLDTKAVQAICKEASISQLNYIQQPSELVSPTTPPPQWLQRILDSHCNSISSACSNAPSHLDTYRLPNEEREVIVQRLVKNLRLGPSYVAFARAWVGEMERFMFLKALHGDTEAQILSPSGEHISTCVYACLTPPLAMSGYHMRRVFSA
jgi:hypothetical protein